MKVNVTLNDDLLKRADEYAKNNYHTRSGLISLALSQYLAQQDCLSAIKGIAEAFKKIAERPELGKNDLEELERYEKFLNTYLDAFR